MKAVTNLDGKWGRLKAAVVSLNDYHRPMDDHFKWLSVDTQYREVRPSKHGDELRWIVTRETILNAETGTTTTRGTIRHPGIAVIVPFLDERRVVLMNQYRYAAGHTLWELPAGTLPGREENGRVIPTETAEVCAARELQEETGYEAASLEKSANVMRCRVAATSACTSSSRAASRVAIRPWRSTRSFTRCGRSTWTRLTR